LLFEHDLFGKALHTFPDHALAHAAISPGCATTSDGAADSAANRARTDRAGTNGATAAGTDATTAAAATGSAATAATACASRQLHAAHVFLVEEMERGETDVGHFLFAKNEALIGLGIARLRGIAS
jgi:hypothetical protein